MSERKPRARQRHVAKFISGDKGRICSYDIQSQRTVYLVQNVIPFPTMLCEVRKWMIVVGRLNGIIGMIVSLP